jgi:hypothetical protein
MSLKDGLVCYLFENTNSKYFGKGFEMIQVLEGNFDPSSISNLFTTLLALFNDTQGDKEGIHEFRSRFEGHLGALSQPSVVIPPILQVMFFLRAIHACYADLLSQFAPKHKDLSHASINSVMADARFMDEFVVVGGKQKLGAPNPSSCSPAAALVATDKEGKQFCNKFEWLATYKPTYVATNWRCSLKGDFYCTICNGKENHHPTKCLLLGKLDLNLIEMGGGGRSGKPGASLGSPPLAGVSTGAKPGALVPPAAVQAAVVTPPAPASGSPSAPAGLTATVEEGDAGNESLTESFQWEGDEDGVNFKLKGSVSFYPPSTNLHPSDRPLRLSTPSCIPSEPSCSQVSLASVAPTASYGGSFHNFSPSDADPLPVDIVLPPGLVSALLKAISPNESIAGLRLVVADTGAMDHMVPNTLPSSPTRWFVTFVSGWVTTLMLPSWGGALPSSRSTGNTS